MAYEYESITNGVFRFTIPGEDRTVELFLGSKVIVKNKLHGNYLKLLKFVREISEENKDKDKVTKAKAKVTKPKAKVEDKIVSVSENNETQQDDTINVKTTDNLNEVVENKNEPKKRGRRKKEQ